MIRKKNFLIITLFFALLVNGQEFDLNNIKIDDVKNVNPAIRFFFQVIK